MKLLDFFKKNDGAEPQNNNYDGLRAEAFDVEPERLGVRLTADDQVYAAITDIPSASGIVTVVCTADGTVSLYSQNGGGLVAMDRQHKRVRDAGMTLLLSSGQVLKYLDKTDDFSLPMGDKAVMRLKARDGVYMSELDLKNPAAEERARQFLCMLLLSVLSAMRTSDEAQA